MLKDEVLNNLPTIINVAQFASFDPRGKMRFNRIRGFAPNSEFTIDRAITELMKNSIEGTLNIRTFKEEESKSGPFFYGIKSVEEVLERIKELWLMGYYTIIHETVDISDGGISGVILKDIIEFSPDATVRGVEEKGTCTLPLLIGNQILKIVYGINVLNTFFFLRKDDTRIEFSIHPIRRGYHNKHFIIWEIEEIETRPNTTINISWPNNFSKMLGDKVYGLLIAHVLDWDVPETYVINKRIAPFRFGMDTGISEKWIRTCPTTPEPGYYPTEFGWTDPFELMNFCNRSRDDAATVQSIISQSAVDALYSGAVKQLKSGEIIIEGVSGRGDKFMSGCERQSLPDYVKTAVRALYTGIRNELGPVHIEWVYSESQVWVVQLHIDKDLSSDESIIVDGNPDRYLNFDVTLGLNELRRAISIIGKNQGICLVGDVGITSHFGDLLRKAKIPSKIVKPRK